MRKRIEALGYSSLKKFHGDRKNLPYSYELLRQVVNNGRIPRAETLLGILQEMRFSPSQTHKIMEFHFGGYPGRPADVPGDNGVINGPGDGVPGGSIVPPGSANAAGIPPGDDPRMQGDVFTESPEELIASLKQSLPRIPLKGNDDFWELMRALARQAERKISRLARREADQPLLFEKEPEAIYQFLVRKGKVPAYMSKGETLSQAFADGIDYRSRFRGALLGAAIGETLGRASQGLSPRDVRELFGRIDRETSPGDRNVPHAGQGSAPPACLILARALLEANRLDPVRTSAAYANSRRMPGTSGRQEFARNLVDRGFPWFEAGAGLPECSPAARVAPLALLRAGDFRRMKLETGIEAAVTHPHASAVAGAIAQASAVARVLHTPAGTLDVLGFARSLSHAVSGIETDRASRGKTGRPGPTLARKLGTELTALLLRRADPEEVQETIGNGASVLEGIPFAWACFLRSPDEFAPAVLSAVNLGNEAEANGAMAGSLAGAYLGMTGIPGTFLAGLAWRDELESAADRLFAIARRDS